MEENKKAIDECIQQKDAMQELDSEDLATVTGGVSLRDAPKTKTEPLSDDTKSRV